MIAQPGTARTLQHADVALPRPRSAEPAVAAPPPTTPTAAAPADDAARDPFLVAAQLESSATLLSWVGRLAVLVAVGLVVLLVLLL